MSTCPETSIRWPSPARILEFRGSTGPYSWIKAWLRHIWSRVHWPILLETLRHHPEWVGLFAADHRYAHCALSHFIDRSNNMAARFQAMSTDLRSVSFAFGESLSKCLAQGNAMRMWSLNDDTHLELRLNDSSYHEGLWALSLRDGRGRRLYYVSFSFLTRHSLIVSTLQGPGKDVADQASQIRLLTKAAFGLRPPALLLACLRALCKHWNATRLVGIAPANHVKGRWNLRGSRLRFDYEAFWREQGGERAKDGHWDLPLHSPPRDLLAAPANKRAMYRRREALLDAMRVSSSVALAVPEQSVVSALEARMHSTS